MCGSLLACVVQEIGSLVFGRASHLEAAMDSL